MNFYLKEWPDHTVSVLTENGQVVWTFPSIDDAKTACNELDSMNRPQMPQPYTIYCLD